MRSFSDLEGLASTKDLRGFENPKGRAGNLLRSFSDLEGLASTKDLRGFKNLKGRTGNL
ncbi:hypothetical protein ADIS_0978 [Lunatimonas lonarensis]|uniref:Uncharacterized protein n=1 Tax=Lunatimonas lonarensis TaxID=1232681 RepID=R7ZX97_9BACT|nr:hypothetical protein ADIS_0978 [Lunatimonas lonarensis]